MDPLTSSLNDGALVPTPKLPVMSALPVTVNLLEGLVVPTPVFPLLVTMRPWPVSELPNHDDPVDLKVPVTSNW